MTACALTLDREADLANSAYLSLSHIKSYLGELMMLTVKQVSARLNCSPGLVYKLVQQGALKAHRINRAVRVSEEQLQEYLTAAAQPIEQPRRAFATKFL